MYINLLYSLSLSNLYYRRADHGREHSTAPAACIHGEDPARWLISQHHYTLPDTEIRRRQRVLTQKQVSVSFLINAQN